jgi:VWFA-related protein
MRGRFGRSIGVAVAVVMAAFGAAAQVDDEPQATFFAPLDVPLVSIEVYVFGRGGQPVPGLSLEDFEVYEDGKKVEISHFYASPGISAAVEDEAETTENDFIDSGPAQALYLVIYFDDTNLSRGRRQAAVEHLRAFLSAELPPDLRVMLVRYDGWNHIEQPFTEETDEVIVALDTLRDAASLSRQIDETVLMREIQNAAALASISGDQATDVLEESGRAIWQSIETFADYAVHRARTSIENESQQRVRRSRPICQRAPGELLHPFGRRCRGGACHLGRDPIHGRGTACH